MKKLNNKGFMLTETLIVAGFVIATLVFLYTQFRTVSRSYTTSFKYNGVGQLYDLSNLGDYLKENGLTIIGEASLVDDHKYIDLTTCTDRFLSETNYCTALISTLNIKKAIITSENLEPLKQVMNNDSTLSEEMKQFISSIRYNVGGTDYQIIAEFTNGTFATLKV